MDKTKKSRLINICQSSFYNGVLFTFRFDVVPAVLRHQRRHVLFRLHLQGRVEDPAGYVCFAPVFKVW